MTACFLSNISAKYYKKNPSMLSPVIAKNVGDFFWDTVYFPRCIECQRGLATRKVSVCPSVCHSVRLSNACVVTKRKKDLSRFLYHMKDI